MACGVLVGCAAPPSAPRVAVAKPSATPDYLTEKRGCAVLAGGSIGSEFADSKVASFWHEINKQIADHLFEELVLSKYRVVKLTISPNDSFDTERLVIAAMSRHRCNRLIQISSIVNEDSQGRFFRYDITLLRAEPKGVRAPGATGTNIVTVGEYTRAYRYPRTDATFKSFYTGTFASTVFSDLTASGAVDPLKLE